MWRTALRVCRAESAEAESGEARLNGQLLRREELLGVFSVVRKNVDAHLCTDAMGERGEVGMAHSCRTSMSARLSVIGLPAYPVWLYAVTQRVWTGRVIYRNPSSRGERTLPCGHLRGSK